MLSRALRKNNAGSLQSIRLKSDSRVARKPSEKSVPSRPSDDLIYLNPHAWKGLPSDRIFELHKLRKTKLGEKYVPNDLERQAILLTIKDLSGKVRPKLEYVYELDNFKERLMSNVAKLPVPKMSNIEVRDSGETPHLQRKLEQLERVSAHEMPLLAKYRQPYTPYNPKNKPLQLKFSTDFSDDLLAKENRKVALNVALEDLDLTKEQAETFKLFAGNKFNHKNNVFHMKAERHGVATQNARFLAETFEKLLEASKTTSFKVPVNTRHCRPRKPEAEFPEEWKRPQDAPEEKYNILRRVVDLVVARKDEQYLAKITP